MDGETVCLIYGLDEIGSDFFLPASAPSSPIKNRPSSSVLRTVLSPSSARPTDTIFAASRSFDERSKSGFMLNFLKNS